jgi:hypothetical protein
MSHFQIGRHGKLAFIGMQLVAQHGKQTGFPCAIGTSQADFLAFMNGETGLAKQQTVATTNSDVFKIKHDLENWKMATAKGQACTNFIAAKCLDTIIFISDWIY